MLRTTRQVLALVRGRGVVTQGALVEAIVGEAVRGSWWGHPEGKRIYALLVAVDDSPDVLSTRLGGRVTFVHRALWPALLRLVTDEGWRRDAIAELPAPARRLFDRVERSGEVRLGGRDPGRDALARSLLAHVATVHTASGRHATVLRSWRAWATRALLDEAARLDLDQAKDQLALRSRRT